MKTKQLLNEAWDKRRSKNYDDALSLVKKVQDLSKEDDYDSLGRIFHADLQREMGQDANSEGNYREVIDIYKTHSKMNIGNLANALRGFALVLEKRHKKTEAVSVWEETRELYQKCGIQAGVDEASDKLESLRQ